MNIIQIYKQRSGPVLFLIIVLAMVNSGLNSCMLAFINYALKNEPLPFLPHLDWLLFIVVMSVSFFCSRLFQRYITRLTNEVVYYFEIDVVEKIRFASFESFEKAGPERVYTAIGDTRILAQIPQVFVSFITSAIMVVCVLAYMFWLSPAGGGGILFLIILLSTFYFVRNQKIRVELDRARDMQNDYYRYLKDFMGGFKEVKMSTARNDRIFYNYIKRVLTDTKDIGIRTANKYLNNELIGSYSWYIVVGAVLFAMPRLISVNPAQVASFLVTIIFIIGPVSSLINVIPFYTRSRIALERLNNLEKDINTKLNSEVKHGDRTEICEHFESIRLEDAGYTYFDKDDKQTFSLAPVSLEIKRGDVIFITGTNGSGKSTFMNLLSGLYTPGSGKVYLNGHPITALNYPYYRDRISAIFTNNYLFSENYADFEFQTQKNLLMDYVKLFKLSSVIRFEDQHKKIDKNLSKGQQKRLAMIYMLLENKDVIMLDEWAAEQDPSFRAYFYQVLIPALKEKGKTIVAITHDSYYYGVADRIIKFEKGEIVYDGGAAAIAEKLLNYQDE